jgi:hypothetical protein
MMLQILKTTTINDLQQGFSLEYPFLYLGFYRFVEGRLGSSVRQRIIKSLSLGSIGVKREGVIDITNSITVRSLEEAFRQQFGLHVQVSRKSGTVWLETTMTNNWTLLQQNTHGRDLSEPNNS